MKRVEREDDPDSYDDFSDSDGVAQILNNLSPKKPKSKASGKQVGASRYLET